MKKIKSLFLFAVLFFTLVPNTANAVTAKYIVKADVEYTIAPDEKITLYVNTKKVVTWSSSSKTVATVSKKGVVTGKAEGSTTITAKVGKKKYKCTVTVYNYEEDLEYLKDQEADYANKYSVPSIPDGDFIFENEDKDPDILDEYDDHKVKEYNAFCKEWISDSILLDQYEIGVTYEFEEKSLAFIKNQIRLITLNDVPADLSGGETYIRNDVQFKYTYDELYFNRQDLINKGIIK